MTDTTQTPLLNRLLAALPESTLQQLQPHLHLVSLRRDEIIYEPSGPIETVYFPRRSAFSALVLMENGSAIEVGTIGNEGGSGLSVLAGVDTSPHRVLIQIPDSALRIKVDVLKRLAHQDAVLRDRLLHYQGYFFAQVSQSVACNGLHPIQKRCCRWLLMTHDRLDSDEVPLTHEYLAMMLGVRRAGVTEVLHLLQDQGAISTSRGKITITDRQRLEDLCCECYRKVKQVYQQLLG
jgi:CRP-like cAMP-binding protein